MWVERIPNETRTHVSRDHLASDKLEDDEGIRKRVKTFWPWLRKVELRLVSPSLRFRGRPAIDPVSKRRKEVKEGRS
jgi:hypothetical protein